jgi:hypothetical protein
LPVLAILDIKGPGSELEVLKLNPPIEPHVKPVDLPETPSYESEEYKKPMLHVRAPMGYAALVPSAPLCVTGA